MIVLNLMTHKPIITHQCGSVRAPNYLYGSGV